MLTIHLKNLHFHSRHGLFPEEKTSGADFEVNLDVSFLPQNSVQLLQDTIDYVPVYNIVSERMNIPTALIETVAENIIEAIFISDERIRKVSVNIIKLNPPLVNFQGKVAITLFKEK